jgi:hypothetical protein
MLTDTRRKYLTELLGECCWQSNNKTLNEYKNRCVNCGLEKDTHKHRTFTTPQDFFDVVRALSPDDVIRVDKKLNHEWMLEAMQQPDFIERFMSELCKLKGVE